MAKNSSVNLDITNNADGFDVSGGTSARKLTVTGANVTLTGSGTNVYTMPAATDTLVGRDSTDTLTNKTLTTPTIAQINNSSAPGVKLQVRTQTDNSNSITSATTAGVFIQYGWGQFLGNGTNNVNDTVTFPTAFTTPLGVTLTFNGFKSGGTSATDITQLTSRIGSGVVAEAHSVSTTGFTAAFSSSGTYGAAYHGYSWIAWGA